MKIFVCKETNYVEYVIGDDLYPFPLANHNIESEESLTRGRFLSMHCDDIEGGAIEVAVEELQQIIDEVTE